MSYPINYPTPQGANVQIFNQGISSSTEVVYTWVKPQGASFVWFTLIGGGGDGTPGANSGGSGAVTNFMCPAFLIPDSLAVIVSGGNSLNTSVKYQLKASTSYELLFATGGSANAGGGATAGNAFTAMGFYQSIAGQDGSAASTAASATTFLSAGAVSTSVTANYGYSLGSGNRSGFFMTQPIVVGCGGIGTGRGGIGCGGGCTASVSGKGGPGMVVIITW